MNEYIFYTTEGFTYPPIEGKDVENCQVLTEENKKDINMVLEYLMEEEFKHYQESAEPENHIYKVLLRLKDMIC